MLDNETKVGDIENAGIVAGFLYPNRSDFARQYIFPTVTVSASSNDLRWLAGFLALNDSYQKGGEKDNGTSFQKRA